MFIILIIPNNIFKYMDFKVEFHNILERI